MFHRGQSRVWYGSQTNSVYDNYYSLPTLTSTAQSSLRSIAEKDELFTSPKNNCEKVPSFNLWANRHSPSSHSHKSQDSGFSDAERNDSSLSPKNNLMCNMHEDEQELVHSSPSASSHQTATPPTVIRRPSNIPIYEEITSARRISFSAPSSPVATACNENDSKSFEELQSQIYEINFNNTSPLNVHDTSRSSCRSCKIKRSRVITKNSRFDRSTSRDSSLNGSKRCYNNETVYFDAGELSMMEEKSLLMQSHFSPSSHFDETFLGGTSTPKSKKSENQLKKLAEYLPPPIVYKNELLNGHFASVQHWIDNLQFCVSSEVMSTLQSKSVEHSSSVIIMTPSLAYKMIKNLQTKVHLLQNEFETVENCADLNVLLPSIQCLTGLLIEFIARQELKNQLYVQCMKSYRKFNENIKCMREMTTDLKRLAGKLDIDDLEDYPIGDDVNLLKRYFLITIKYIFEALIGVIADHIEYAQNEMILKSNLMHVASLASNEYFNDGGFASLHDAYVSNSIVRVLLLICIENGDSSTRSQALRALSLICSNVETIHQFEINSGFEILRDVMTSKLTDTGELKEAISCLASITAPWQKSSNCSFKELKDHVESYVETITNIVEQTNDGQTLLICSAVLNNFTRLETTTVYSLMSHQTIGKLIAAYEKCNGGDYNIFILVSFPINMIAFSRHKNNNYFSYIIQEQITSLILNMCLNKKSTHHLSHRMILNFLTSILQSISSVKYNDSAKEKAQKCIISNTTNVMRQLLIDPYVSYEISESLSIALQKFHRKIEQLENLCDLTSSYLSCSINRSSKNVTSITIGPTNRHETFF